MINKTYYNKPPLPTFDFDILKQFDNNEENSIYFQEKHFKFNQDIRKYYFEDNKSKLIGQLGQDESYDKIIYKQLVSLDDEDKKHLNDTFKGDCCSRYNNDFRKFPVYNFLKKAH